MQDKKKILFIASGPAAPGTTKEDNPFFFLSEYLSGHVIGSTWPNENHKEYVEGIQSSFGNFKYHAFKYSSLPSIFKNISHLIQYLRLGSKVLKENKVDVIVSYGFLVTGISSTILSRWYKIPLFVEVPGVPHKAIKFSSSKLSFIAKAVLFFSMRFTLEQAKVVWFLFKKQLDDLYDLSNKKVFVAHDFAPVSMYSPVTVQENIISFIGYPWELKGVDTLIEAFKIISIKFPDARLRIAGHCPDRRPYELLSKGFEDKIEFFKGMDRKECIKFMTSTKIFVLPSRTEAMGRVLLEAMASEKTIIGSNVDGIPHYLDHEKTGLLFETDNIQDLAQKLEQVLIDKDLADKLAKNARQKVLNKYTEKHFAKNFNEMILATLILN